MDDLVSEFLTETNERLDMVDLQLVQFEREPNNAQILDSIFRLVHTIKGTCGFLDLPRLAALSHAAETAIGAFRDGVPVTRDAVTLILESIDRLKEIMAGLAEAGREPEGGDADIIARLEAAPGPGSAGAPTGDMSDDVMFVDRPPRPGEVSLEELERAFREAPGPDDPEPAPAPPNAEIPADDEEAVKNGLAQTASIRVNLDTLEHLITTVSELVLTRNQLLDIARRHADTAFETPLQRLSNVTAELQEGVLKARMQPIGNAWQKLPRLARDLARELGKEIELEMSGAETELDRQVLELIRDPLTHMVRNCADHGLETPDARRAAGKPPTGTIRLGARHEGGHVIIEIADDGRGLDLGRIGDKIVERGLASRAELGRMSEAQIHRFIFAPGFSTAEALTSVSGRGVGMDVVRSNLDAIGGSVDVRSVPGEGAVFIVKIPLTLAIISALVLEAGGQRFALPQISILELVRARSGSRSRIERINDTLVLRLRDRLLPLLDLRTVLGLEPPEAVDADFICVMQVGAQEFGILVDAIVQTEEIVVKPLSNLLRHLPVFAGTTILGDGTVIMILDPNGLSGMVRAGPVSEIDDRQWIDESTAEARHETVPMLLFRAGSQQLKMVPLSLVTRLEEIDAARIEHSNGRALVQYRGRLMPVVYANDEVRRGVDVQPLIVFTENSRAMGLAVDEIVDVVEDRLDIEIGSQAPGVLGTAIIRGKATEAIDIGHYLPLASGDWGGREVERPEDASRVLLVDDSDFFRNMLVPVLQSAGYEVLSCETAVEALARLEAGERVDAVVTDIEMPEMDGFELTARLRANARFDHVPVIGLSSQATRAAIARGHQAGLHDFVAKFDRVGLLASLQESVARLGEAA